MVFVPLLLFLCDKGDHETITLKESVSLLSQGTTGLRTWEASLHLTEWMMEDPSFFKSKYVRLHYYHESQ